MEENRKIPVYQGSDIVQLIAECLMSLAGEDADVSPDDIRGMKCALIALMFEIAEMQAFYVPASNMEKVPENDEYMKDVMEAAKSLLPNGFEFEEAMS